MSSTNQAISSRFTWLSPAGIALPFDASHDQVGAVRINSTGIIVSATLPNEGKPAPWKKIGKAAAAQTFAGHQCRFGSMHDVYPLIDFSRRLPAFDPEIWFFLAEAYKKEWLLWTSDASAAYPESGAWYVNLNGGNAYLWHQDYHGLALSVCGPFPSPGQ